MSISIQYPNIHRFHSVSVGLAYIFGIVCFIGIVAVFSSDMPAGGKIVSAIAIAVIGAFIGIITMAGSEALNAIAQNEINTQKTVSGILELNQTIKNLNVQQSALQVLDWHSR